MDLKQFVPQEFCLKCDGCCRFSRKDTPWSPYKRELSAYRDHFFCSSFSIAAQRCRDYENRFLDCRIYPFLLHRSEAKVYLAADQNCHYLSKNFNSQEFNDYCHYLEDFLNSDEVKGFLRANPGIIVKYEEGLKIISEITLDSDALGRRLALEDKPLFDGYLNQHYRELSALSFANIYIWRPFFDIRYKVIKGRLCVFFKDKIGCFMYLPPLGAGPDSGIISECFELMDSQNADHSVSRIENIAEVDRQFYRLDGFNLLPKDEEYVYLRQDLDRLSGDKFKAKRALRNYFMKNYKYSYEPLTANNAYECLSVLATWRKERLKRKEGPRPTRQNGFVGLDDIRSGGPRPNDIRSGGPRPVSDIAFYRYLLDDNCLAQEEALLNFFKLGLSGKVVKVDERITAYTFGFELNADTFCIISETADLGFKGISQFLFWRFCLDLVKYKYINVMDDSGLENIRRVKLSYRPHKKQPSYILKRF